MVIESVDDLMSHGPPSMNMSEDPECWSNRDSFIQHGSYDTLHDIEILAHDPYAAKLPPWSTTGTAPTARCCCNVRAFTA